MTGVVLSRLGTARCTVTSGRTSFLDDGKKERRWTAIFAADGVPKCRSIACNQRNRLDDFAELVSGSGGSTHYYT